MLANTNGCRYECGLDNVTVEGYPLTAEPGIIRVKRINQLHQVIAEATALKPGPLRGREVRFLRTHLGLTPAELADKIDLSQKTVYAVEAGTLPLGKEQDIEVRRLVFTHHDSPMPTFGRLYELFGTACPEKSDIRVAYAEDSWQLVAA